MGEPQNLHVQMSIVVDGMLGDREYKIPEDFMPPFLESAQAVKTTVTESFPAEVVEVPPEAPQVPETVHEEVPSDEPEFDTVIPPTRKKRALMGVIRGAYTVIFSLLGMLGAAVAYVKDNLDKLTDIKWQTIAVVVAGALLAGFGYGLKKYYKPDGLL